MKNLQGAASHPAQIDPTSYNISWLENFLQRTRRRYWMLNGLGAVLESTLGLVLFGCVLALLRTQIAIPGLHYYWWAGLSVAAFHVIRSTYRHYKLIAKIPIAEQVEDWNPQASGFLTAIELGRDLPDLEKKPLYSATLSQARIDQVASTMRTIHPMEIVPVTSFRRRAYAFLVFALFFFGALIWFPRPMASTLHALFYPPHKNQANPLLQADHDALVVGDLKVTYRYPAYSGKGIRTLPNSDGSLSALKGTRATLQARSLFPITRAAIHLNNKTFLKLQISADKRGITGHVDMLRPGFYRFVLNGADGTVHRGPTHPIQVLADQKPKVKLLSPTQNLELKSEKRLRVAYRFSDDFGISKIYLVYQNKSSKHLKKPERKLLQDLTQTRSARNGIGEGTWDLQNIPSSPGDRIAYYIEVHDTDTISGPNKGRSEVRYVRLYSPLKEHQKLIKAQEKLFGQMTLFLADLIEQPTADKGSIQDVQSRIRKLNVKAGGIVKNFDSLIVAMRKSILTKPYTLIAMENLRHRFDKRLFARKDLSKQIKALQKYSPFLRRNVETTRKAEIPPQEDDVYAFLLLLNRQQLDLLTNLARQLDNARNRLRDLLEQYKQKKTPEIKRELMRQMDRVERLIREINKRMRRLYKSFSDGGYFNMQAFKNKSDLNTLRQMRKDIKQDRLASAADKLAKLAVKLEKKISQLDQFAKEAGGGLVSRMAAAMQKTIQDMNNLLEKQKRLARMTQQVRRKLLKRMQKALKGKLDKLLKKQLQRAAQIKFRLNNVRQHLKQTLYRYRYDIRLKTLEKRIDDLKKMLKHKDIFASLDVIRRYQTRNLNMQGSLRYLRSISNRWNYRRRRLQRGNRINRVLNNLSETNEIARRIERDLSRFFPDPKPYMKPRDKALMKRYQRYQKQLHSQAQRMQQRLQRMARRMPMFNPKTLRKFSDAAKEMKGASNQLGKHQPKPAHGHQQEAIKKLQQCQSAMRKSMQPKKRGSSGKRQGNKNQKGGGRPGMRGQSMRNQKVKIPKPGEHKAPKALRQDILDAMKEKLPHRYRRPVRKYYEKLVK